MFKKITMITGLLAFSSAVFCSEPATLNKEMLNHEAQQFEQPNSITRASLEVDTQTTLPENKILEHLQTVAKNDLSIVLLMTLENYQQGSLSRAVSSVAMLQKLNQIDEKLQTLVELLKERLKRL